ncbi:YDG domain-containing protein [Allosphingosinicella deserti]|uniref:Filamentous haemagglutinin FhaB/tRNA nuclease CdiA-like TPS domain-containing protein n=1 Tax=Allosphingosinicella deserti TaxID=2116704 RepID=A0A2P7QSM2_9SPHN|nr:YDG domain-containing protein [Sphingomonas deserti]PSJ40959.1 hypothetical protein C7I55_11910 [Sphingomonas deserti]
MSFSSRLPRRRLLALTTALCGILASASPAVAQQMGGFGTVQSRTGPVSVAVSGTNLNVSATGSGIVNWTDFNVQAGSIAAFRNGNGSQAANVAILNRVLGTQPTTIGGALTSDANVSVYLVNSNGIMFGSSSQVNLGSLVASTLDVTDADFLDGDGRLTFTSNDNPNAYLIVGSGAQMQTKGDLVLLGDTLSSDGSLQAGGDLAAIAAGRVTVQSAVGSPLKFEISRGSLQASLRAGGAANGRNVVLGAVGQAGVTDGLLEVEALATATGVAASDHGVTIFAGNEVSAPNVVVHSNQSARIDITGLGTIRSSRDIIVDGNSNVGVNLVDAAGAASVEGRGIVEVNQVFADEMVLTGLYLYAGGLDAKQTIALYGSEVASITGDVTAFNVSVNGRAIYLGDDSDSEVIAAAYIQTNAGTGGINGGAGLTLDSQRATVLLTTGGANFDRSSRIRSSRSLLFGGGTDQRVTLGDVDVGAIAGLDSYQADITFGNLNVGSDLLIATTDDLRADSITSAGALTMSGLRMEFGGDLIGENKVTLAGKTLTARNVRSRTDDVAVETSADGIALGSAAGRAITLTSRGGGITVDGIDATSDVLVNAYGAGIVDLGHVKAGASISLMSEDVLRTGSLHAADSVNAYGTTVSAGDVRADTGSAFLTAGIGSVDAGDVTAGKTISLRTEHPSGGAGVVKVGAVSGGGNVEILSDDLVLDHALSGRSVWLKVADGGTIALHSKLTAKNLTVEGGALVQASGAELTAGTLTGSLRGEVSLTGNNHIGAIRDLSATSLDLVNDHNWIEIIGSNRFAGDVSLVTSGSLQIGGGSSLGGELVSLAVGDRFTNSGGGSAISATKNWAIYLNTPDGQNFGGLDSGNRAIWGSDASRSPITSLNGDRYVFTHRPTLTFYSVQFDKTYGTDVAAYLANRYNFVGLHQGVAGAFQGDVFSDIVQGRPVLTSAGAAATAGVAGGPYTIDIAQGSLVASGGYDLAFESSGVLRVSPKQLTAAATVDSKVYDGTDAASGSIALSGLLFDDVVNASGVFRFDDKNAGTGKIVTAAGVALHGADAANYVIDGPIGAVADILRKDVQVTIAADSKIYDGTRSATGRVSRFDGLVTGDDVVLGGGEFAFSDKNAGVGKTVSISGLTFGGADAGNYSFATPATAAADILRKDVAVSVAADTKTYDGGTSASGRITAIDGIIAGDALSFTSGDFAFADKNAGAGKQVLVSGIGMSGADSGNYTLVLPAATTADILRRDVVVAVTADAKTYDGGTRGSGRIISTDGIVAGDALSFTSGDFAFADKNAGAGKQVLVSGIGMSGADSGNYTLVLPATTTADILRRDVVVAVTADAKTYDGGTRASGRINSTDGIVAGDALSFTSGDFAFVDKNAGAGKQVLVSGIALGGADSGNYALVVPATTTASINRKMVTVGVVADDKVYDGSVAAVGRAAALDGLVAGDEIVIEGGRYAFVDKNAGIDKQVLVSGLGLAGADSANYTLAVAPTATADIARRTISVRADDVHAPRSGSVPPLRFSILSGSLVDGEVFAGMLQREPGNAPGAYRIGLGTLALSDNYDLQFQAGTFTIDPDPSAGWTPRLYQEFELGGRAQALQSTGTPLRWTAAPECGAPERESECS